MLYMHHVQVPILSLRLLRLLRLSIIKGLCVIDVAESVRVTELMQMKQGHGELICTFAARLRNKAQVCTLSANCTTCNKPVS